jgi:AraC-like DNA-binding protein
MYSHNVTEAALAVGFKSLSHFNSTFHSFMGASPSDYMRIKEKQFRDLAHSKEASSRS